MCVCVSVCAHACRFETEREGEGECVSWKQREDYMRVCVCVFV